MSRSESRAAIAPGAYGEAIGFHFGLQQRLSSIAVHDLGQLSLAVTRVRRGAGRVTTAPLPSEAAALVMLHLREAPGQQFWVRGRPLSEPRTLAAGTVQVVDLRCHPAWRLDGPFDCLHLYVPHAALERAAAEHGCEWINDVAPPAPIETEDPVLTHLGSCFLQALEHPREASRACMEHLALGLHSHLARTYYGISLSPIEGALNDIACGFDLAEVASKCRMSVAHFRHAFRRHTGQTPHRWLTRRRVERARDLLTIGSLPLAEIALRCGFSDQSHFTRVFAQITGTTPGAWRRATC